MYLGRPPEGTPPLGTPPDRDLEGHQARQDRSARCPAIGARPRHRPEVIADFSVQRGLLFVVLRNIGAASAWDVITRFDRPFHGLGAMKDISTLALFRSLAFMPPDKQFTQLVDPIAAYFQRDEAPRLTATFTYGDREGHGYSEVVPHDLTVYRDLAETVPR